jgi:hypothetical protein
MIINQADWRPFRLPTIRKSNGLFVEYGSIQAAVDAWVAGDVLYIPNVGSSYDEQVTIVDGIVIIGIGLPYIAPASSASSYYGAVQSPASACTATIFGVRMKGTSSTNTGAGFVAQHTSGTVTLIDCETDGSGPMVSCGVYCGGAGAMVIRNVSVPSSTTVGITQTDTCVVTVHAGIILSSLYSLISGSGLLTVGGGCHYVAHTSGPVIYAYGNCLHYFGVSTGYTELTALDMANDRLIVNDASAAEPKYMDADMIAPPYFVVPCSALGRNETGASNISPGERSTITFPDNTVCHIYSVPFIIPKGWTNGFTIKAIIPNDVASTFHAYIRTCARGSAIGGTTDAKAINNAYSQVLLTSGKTNWGDTLTVPVGSYAVGDIFNALLYRNSIDVLDTIDNTVTIWGFCIAAV